MVKYFIYKYVVTHKDVLEVTLATTGGLGVWWTTIEYAAKLLLTFISIAYIAWKWYKDYRKGKVDNKSE